MLNANGGFINVALQKFAESFFVFGFLYRLFIFLSESFNGFYVGLTRGDPVGPFAYALPALVGMIVLFSLAFGEWTESKRVRAWRAAQLMGLIVLYVLAFRGLVAQPIDISWTYFASILTTIVILMSAAERKKGQLRAVQICGLVLFGAGIVFTLVTANGSFSGDTGSYLLALALGSLPILISFVGAWDRRKYRLLAGIAILFGAVILVRCIPGQLDGGKLSIVPRYLTFQSTIEHLDDATYLKTTYINEAVSPLWVWSLAIAALIGGALLNARYPRARRLFLYAALAFFVLFTLSTILDGVRYFQAFDTIAQATGKPAYHFTLFRASIGKFPAEDRVPLWMTNELWSKPSLILITLWSSGTGMLIFLAALKGVPRSLYEAAEVDGASGVQKFFRITLPMISPAMFYNLVIGIIAALQTFDTVYVLQNTQTENSLASAAYALFTRTFRQLYIGEGSAISWILVIIIMTITVIQFRFSGWVYYEA
jgi:ABC-type sugar transport system permease subunit